MFGGPLEPDAAWARLPAFSALVFLRGDRVEGGNPNVENDTVFVSELRLALAFDVDEGVAEPAAGEVEIFFNAVPFHRVELAAGEEVECGTGGYCYVGDDETWMVVGEGVVYGIWKDVEAVVEEEDEEEDYGGKDAELDARSDLMEH